MGMWLTSCPEVMGWGFWDLKKKTVCWVLGWDGASWFSELAEGRPVRVYGMHARWLSQWVESWRCTNSQHSKKLCLSLLMSENLKLKKVNKSFVPEPRKSSIVSRVFGFLWTLWTFYEHCERFTYLGRIFGPIYYISSYISVNIQPILAILLYIINFCFDIIGSYGIICAAI